MTIKAVLDTNVLISGIFWTGAPFRVLKAWQDGQFMLAISPPVLEEYRRVVAEMTGKRPVPVLGQILEVIELRTEMVAPASLARAICSDPDDDKFLATALAAGANYVVSGDGALLRVKSYGGVEIVRPARFLTILSS